MTEPTVHAAWAAVMADVQAIRKGERNAQQGFNFRGIDAVMNAVGPALRDHHVTVVPEALSIDTERYQTAKGGHMQAVIVHMRYTVHGPAGDTFTGSAYGQAADAGDKAVSKAISVAYRTFLLQALTIPTDEPDPDHSVHERGGGVPPLASQQQLKALHAELTRHHLTTNEQRHQMGSWAMDQAHPGHPPIASMSELTAPAASLLIDNLKNREPKKAEPQS